MWLRALLVASLVLNVALLAGNFLRRPARLESLLRTFTQSASHAAIERPETCDQGDEAKKGFCREGRAFWQALRALHGEFASAAKFPEEPEALLMWGLALSGATPEKVAETLQQPLSDLQREYLSDGIGFGWRFLNSHAVALRNCGTQAFMSLRAFCRFGVGRAEVFLSQDLTSDFPEEHAGQVFAQHFTSHSKSSVDPADTKAVFAAKVGEALSDPSHALLEGEECLLRQHILKCADGK